MTQIKEHVASFASVNLTLVVHTKCWKGAFCMDYEAKITEVKQAR